jgi:hypothetical protein
MNRNPLGSPSHCIYAVGKPWGVPYLTLHEMFLEREANLVSIKSASPKFSCFAALPCRCHISHVRTPSNANSESILCVKKLYSTLVFIGFLRNEGKIPKMTSQDNLSDFGLVCAIGISGTELGISPSSLDRIGLSICPTQSSQHGPQLW